jgi:hypothetical protein
MTRLARFRPDMPAPPVPDPPTLPDHSWTEPFPPPPRQSESPGGESERKLSPLATTMLIVTSTVVLWVAIWAVIEAALS